MVHGRDRVLPNQLFFRYKLTQIASARAHIAVRELEPSLCKRIMEFLRVGQEAARDCFVSWVHTQGQIGGGHHGSVALGGVMRINDCGCARAVFGPPLVRARWAFGQLPFVAEQGF